MNSPENSAEYMLKEILNNFFDEKEIYEFSNQLLGDVFPKTDIKLMGKVEKEQIQFEVLSVFDLRSHIDLLITFSQSKLEKRKYLELSLNLGQFALSAGELNIAANILERVFEITAGEEEYEIYSANSYILLAQAYRKQAQWKGCFEAVKKAHTIFKKIADTNGLARCENILGVVYGDRGNKTKAKRHFEKSLSYINPDAEQNLAGMLEMNLGNIYSIEGNRDAALVYYKSALNRFEKIGDLRRLSEIKNNMGMIYIKDGDFDQAIKEFDRSIADSMKIGYLHMLGMSYLNKAYIYSQIKDYLLATAYSDKAMEICNKINDRLSIAEIYKIKGIIQRNLKNYSISESYLQTSLRINIELKNELNQAESAYELGLLYHSYDRKEEGNRFLNEALSYYKKIKSEKEISKINNLIHN